MSWFFTHLRRVHFLHLGCQTTIQLRLVTCLMFFLKRVNHFKSLLVFPSKPVPLVRMMLF